MLFIAVIVKNIFETQEKPYGIGQLYIDNE